jgi:branched-subunit amino acid transport protein
MPEATVLMLVAVAIAGTYAWRLGGVLVAGRVEEGSPFFAWVTCVSFAIAAGLMMKLLVLPTGTLSATSFVDRSLAFVAAVAVFYLAKRRLVPALVVGVVLFFVLVSVRSAT